ncbi:MAG: DMT family transporter [Halocynthiibacter sp.]
MQAASCGLFFRGQMDFRAIFAGVAFVAMWSSAFTSARIAVADAPPFLLLSVRFLVSGALALLIGRALGQRISLNRRQWIAVAVFGVCQNGIYLGANFMALQWVEASVAVIVASLLPILVAGASWAVLGEKLPPMGILGLLAGFIGVLVIMSARLSGGLDAFGLALLALGVVALTVATLAVRNAGSGGNVLMVVGLQMLIGSAVLLPVSLVHETWQINWTWSLALAFTYITLVPGLVATVLWFWLVARIGATRAATFHFLNPFFGVAVAALVLSESLSLRDAAGVAVIMAGILAVQLSRRA